MIRSSLLSELPWLEHGFGTREEPLSQDGMATLKQIHSAAVLTADAPGPAGEGDALVTDRAGVALSVRTADCYPILLADIDRRIVAAVHAGWRGTAAGACRAALERMASLNGTEPARVFAAIGPGIGGCCYEVGAEVATLFGKSEAGKIDLAEANYRQLRQAGVPHENIELLGDCTFCNALQFHSFRRERERAGRMISYIGVKPIRGLTPGF